MIASQTYILQHIWHVCFISTCWHVCEVTARVGLARSRRTLSPVDAWPVGTLQHPAQPPGDGYREIIEQGLLSTSVRCSGLYLSSFQHYCFMFTCLGTNLESFFTRKTRELENEPGHPHDPLYLYQNILRRRLIETLGQPHRHRAPARKLQSNQCPHTAAIT